MPIAVLIMVTAMSLIPLSDTAGKLLIENHGFTPVQVGWSRFAMGVLLATPLVLVHRVHFHLVLDRRVLLRGALISSAIVCILTALSTEDIGSVFGAFFVGPILSYGLSAVFLGESVSRLRTVLLGLGFMGVLLVVKPGFGMTAGLGFAMLAGVFYGAYLTTGRWLAEVAPPPILLWAQLATGTILLGLPAFSAPLPGHLPLGLLVLSAGGSLAGNLLLLIAYGRQGATVLAPFIYFQLVFATFYGVVVFDTLPDAFSMAGLGLLLATGFASLALRRSA